MGVAAVAKRKKTGPKPNDRTRDAMVSVKCFADWKVWLVEFARHERVSPTILIDLALARLAEAKEFRPPPER